MSPAMLGVSWETMARDLFSKFDDIELLSSEIDPVTLEDYKHYYSKVCKIHKLRFQYRQQLYPNDEYSPMSGDFWKILATQMYSRLYTIHTISNDIKPSTLEEYGVYRQKVEEWCAHVHDISVVPDSE